MNRWRKAWLLGWVILMFLAGGALAQPQPLVWDGSHWKDMTTEIKVAYIKGIGNMADLENTMGGAGRAACISRAFVQELKTKTVGQIITEVDKFYQANPGKVKTPVIEVVLRQCTQLCPPEPPAAKKNK